MPLLNNWDINLILRSCLNDDRKSQKELYSRLYEFAMKVCCRYITDSEECIESVNESFCTLLKSLHKFNGTRKADTFLSLKEWFRRILINTCVDHYHKIKSNSNDRGPNSIGMSGNDPIEAIRSLLPPYRMVFNLFVIDGLNHEEISQLLGISINTSQAYLSEARGQLKTLLLDNKVSL